MNATLIGQMLSFLVFVWFCMKYVWPPIMQALREREVQIADGMAAAERGVQQLEEAEQQASKTLDNTKSRANEIIAQAEKRGSDIVEQAKLTAQQESLRIKESAEAELAQQVLRAKEHLREQVSSIAVAGAEQILKREVDTKAHKKALDALVAQI